jgi:hypothetical protein
MNGSSRRGIIRSNRGINDGGKVHQASWYAFVLYWLQETYHTRLSSITQDDICVSTLLTDYQKSTYQQTKSLSSISIDNHVTPISFFLTLTFSLYNLAAGLDLSRIPQHLQNITCCFLL